MWYIINCPCGYKYYYDHDKNEWCVSGSKYNSEPVEISSDLKLIACPECNTVYLRDD